MPVALDPRFCAKKVRKLCVEKHTYYLSEGSRFSGRIFRRASGPMTPITTPRVLSASSLYSKFF